MKSSTIVIASFVLLAFHRGVTASSCSCLPPTLTTGLSITNAQSTYDLTSTIAVACNLNYVATGGSATGVCTRSNSNCVWSWSGEGKLQCTEGCLAPGLTQGVEYVLGDSSTSYLNGTDVSLTCSTNYGFKAGSTKGTCNGTTFTWMWASGKQLECDPACPAPVLTTGTEFASDRLSEYIVGNGIELRCSTGYASTGGAASATCLSNNTWQWNGAGMLQCAQACPAPTLPIGTEFASGNSSEYTLNDVITLKCSSDYIYTSGGTSMMCLSDNTWSWSGRETLQCTPVCSLPTLSSGVQLVSSTSATYILGSTITVSCILDYGIFSGSDTATCRNNHIWDWTSLGQLQCRPTCLPPATGSYATISTGFSKAIYLLNQTIQYECESGYVPLSGGSSGMCSSINRWTWQAGASAPLRCVIAPPYKDRRSDIFKLATCKSYVIRKTPTSATCLISCLNDGYCRGYSFDGSVCHLDRPFIEAAAANSMNCFARENSQT